MSREIKRFTSLELHNDPTIQRRIMRKDWKSLGVKGATHMEKDPKTGDLVFLKIKVKR